MDHAFKFLTHAPHSLATFEFAVAVRLVLAPGFGDRVGAAAHQALVQSMRQLVVLPGGSRSCKVEIRGAHVFVFPKDPKAERW